MFYIDNEYVSYGDFVDYDGPDEIMQKIRNEFLALSNNRDFQNDKKPFILKFRDGIIKYDGKTGIKEGKKGVFIPFTTTVKTNTGSRLLTFCENAYNSNEGMVFEPKGEWFKKTWMLYSKDIDKLIFMKLFCPQVINSGLLVFENISKESGKIAEKRGRDSSVSFYLYNKMSPLYNDIKRVKMLAQAWGVPNVGAFESIDQIKNALFDAVLHQEKTGGDMGIDAFEKAVNIAVTPDVTTKAMIRDAIDKGVLNFNNKEYAWYLIGAGTSKSLVKVSPTDYNIKENILTSHLMASRGDYDLVSRAIGGDTFQENESRMNVEPVQKKAKAINIYSESELRNMKYRKLQSLGSEFGLKVVGVSGDDIVKQILDYQS